MPTHRQHASLTSNISRLTKVAADMAAANGDDNGKLGPAIIHVVASALHMAGVTTKSVKLKTGRKYAKSKNAGRKTGGQNTGKKADSDDDDNVTISESSGSSQSSQTSDDGRDGCEDPADEDYYSDTIYVQQRNPTPRAGTSAGVINLPATRPKRDKTIAQSAPPTYRIRSRSSSIETYIKLEPITPVPSRIPVATQNPPTFLDGGKKRKSTVDHDTTRAKK